MANLNGRLNRIADELPDDDDLSADAAAWADYVAGDDAARWGQAYRQALAGAGPEGWRGFIQHMRAFGRGAGEPGTTDGPAFA